MVILYISAWHTRDKREHSCMIRSSCTLSFTPPLIELTHLRHIPCISLRTSDNTFNRRAACIHQHEQHFPCFTLTEQPHHSTTSHIFLKYITPLLSCTHKISHPSLPSEVSTEPLHLYTSATSLVSPPYSIPRLAAEVTDDKHPCVSLSLVLTEHMCKRS